MAEKTLGDLFFHVLQDIYYAEKKILDGLPDMAKAANREQLSDAFLRHREQTQSHVTRLEQVFELLGEKPRGKTCPAMNGILEEAKEMMKDFKGSPACDAALIAAAQAVEHYEITRYGTLRSWAQTLGMDEAVDLFGQTLDEESATDEELSRLAEQKSNPEAQEAAE